MQYLERNSVSIIECTAVEDMWFMRKLPTSMAWRFLALALLGFLHFLRWFGIGRLRRPRLLRNLVKELLVLPGSIQYK